MVQWLKHNAISGNLRKILQDFSDNQRQMVLLSGQVSWWASVTEGLPQGSILNLLFFLSYINYLLKGLSSKTKLFPNDNNNISRAFSCSRFILDSRLNFDDHFNSFLLRAPHKSFYNCRILITKDCFIPKTSQ